MEGIIFVGAVLIGIGALFCFFGYAIFRIILALTGFFMGGITAAALLGAASNGDALLVIIGFLGGGVIGAALLVLLYFIGIFLIGMGLGVGITYGILTLMGLVESDFSVLLALFLGVISGVLALIIQRILIILSTAFNGSGMMVTGMAMITTIWDIDLDRLADDPDRQLDIISDEAGIAFFIIWLALGIVGAVFQFFYTGRQAPRQRPYPHGAPGYAGPPAGYPQQPYHPPAPQPYQQANYSQPYGQSPYPQQPPPYQQSGYPGQAPTQYQPPGYPQQAPPYQPPPPAQHPSSPGYPQPPSGYSPPQSASVPPPATPPQPPPPPWDDRPGGSSEPGPDQPG